MVYSCANSGIQGIQKLKTTQRAHHPAGDNLTIMEDSLEEVHEELLAWAESIGVKINGIRPMRLSGRGFGSESLDTQVHTLLDSNCSHN